MQQEYMPPGANSVDPTSGPNDATKKTAHQARIEQLTTDGLIQFYRSALPEKIILFPEQLVAPPLPIVHGYRCKAGFSEKHDRVTGIIPASGIFIFENCYIGKCGTVMDKDRRILFNDDLVSAYWMWFLGKMITKAVIQNTAVGQSTIGRFIGGSNESLRHMDTQGFTLVNLTKPGPLVYGHWILDLLPMVFNFFEAVQLGEIKPPFKFLLAEAAPAWARRLLTMIFDIASEDILTFNDDKEILHVDRVIVPSLLRVSPLISPRMNNFVNYVFDKLKIANLPQRPDLPRRLFISRENFTADDNRVLVNHAEVVEAIREAGLVPITPERLSWPEQLKLFSEAEVVMGEYGSGLHNTLFSPASTLSIVMVNLKSNWNQSSIAGLRGQEVIYIKPSMQERVGKANGIRFAFDVGTLHSAIALAKEIRPAS